VVRATLVDATGSLTIWFTDTTRTNALMIGLVLRVQGHPVVKAPQHRLVLINPHWHILQERDDIDRRGDE
jgi:hypothetical protein